MSVSRPEPWLDKALDLFSDLLERIGNGSDSPMALWIELHLALEDAYREVPINEGLIRRIYDYAAWCMRQPESESADTDLSTAVAVAFIENLPLDMRVAADLYRWLSMETFEGCEGLFRYHLSDAEYGRLREDFLSRKKSYEGPSHF